VDSVGEDKELELKLLKERYKIEYIDSAIIFDEKTSKSHVFVNQRRRWIAAQLGFFRSHFIDGVSNFVSSGNLDYFDKVVQMIQPPRILLAGMLTIITVLSGLSFFSFFNFLDDFFVPSFNYWFTLFIVTFLSLIISVPVRFYSARTFIALFRVPQGFLLMLLSLMKIRGANSKFIHTEHSHTDDVVSKKRETS
jgi:cellulose synthase/poly-beta-1,6-N-acetylglucosamine synthase-like glycosyltransferase